MAAVCLAHEEFPLETIPGVDELTLQSRAERLFELPGSLGPLTLPPFIALNVP